MRTFRVCGVSIAALSMQDAATRLVEAAIERRSYQVHLCNYTSLAACIQIPRIVTVIHDLQFLTFPQYFSRRKRLFQRLAVKTTCRRSSSVVAISKFTASEVLRFEPSVCSKLTAIPNPIDWSRFRDHARPATAGDFPKRFFLLPAAQYPHKNIQTVVEALKFVLAEDANVGLVLTGQIAMNLHSTVAAGPTLLGTNVHMLGHVTDSELAWLYSNCTAVVIPSLYEGFGLPAVEVLGQGRPVIHSGRTALAEVTQGLGTTVLDPLHPKEWARAMLDVQSQHEDALPSHTLDEFREQYSLSRVGQLYWKLLRTGSSS